MLQLHRADLPGRPLGPAASHLSRILLTLDGTIIQQGGLEPLLRALDESKDQLADHFSNRLGSELVAKALTLKVLNLLLAKYHFLARHSTLLSKPYGLIADPVNNCNLACPGCVHSVSSRELHRFEWNAGVLTEDRYDALLRQYGPSAIQTTLYNYGEPLLNPHTPRFIRKAKAYLTRTALSTNMAVKRFDAQAYALSGLDFMTLSIDGATQPVYEKFRRKGDLETVFRNVRSLVEAKRKEGRRSPVLNWQFLAFEHNAHQIEEARNLAQTMGVDQFTVGNPFDVTWDDPAMRAAAVVPALHQFQDNSSERMQENWNPFPDELESSAIERAFETGWLSQLTPELRRATAPTRSTPPPRTCHYLYKNIVMDANGRVFPCCAAPQPDADLHFANFDAGAPDSFNSEKYQQARLSFSKSNPGAAPTFPIVQTPEPYCVKCDWYDAQMTAHIDRSEVRSYMISSAVVDAESARLLSSW